jgi:hypothetical protein
MTGLKDIDYVLAKLAYMRSERIWPNGLRYLWTDAFGVVLLVSLYEELKEQRFLDEAVSLAAEVDRVLGRKRGIRIGKESDRDGQYFHYLTMWLYALSVLGRYEPAYRGKGIALAHDIHGPFVVPGRGVIWKMKEDLSGPYPAMASARSMPSTALCRIVYWTSRRLPARSPKCARSSTGPPGPSSSPKTSDSA